MRTFLQPRICGSLIIGCGLLIIAASTAVSGQSAERKNNPYAPSPAGNSMQVISPAPRRAEIASVRNEISVDGFRNELVNYQSPDPSIVKSGPASISPTDIYKIGVNDVLHIKLANASNGSAFYVVRSDGTIDFPLAGDNINVKGLTVPDVVEKLRTSIKLFAEPKVEVEISEYASHMVLVSGKVKNPGEKYLRREAVPLFVIKAEAIVDADANSVKTTNAKGETETHLLHDARTDGLLIQQGTKLEFTTEQIQTRALYFIAGSEKKTLERPISLGLTLSKVAASEGADAKKATIHRQNKDGKFISRDYDLKAISAGKSADPSIEAGDIIRLRD